MKISKEKLKKKNKGITLVALVVTIVILLILAGITINAILGQNSIFDLARRAGEATNQAVENEQRELGNLINFIKEEDWGSETEKAQTPVSIETSYVGYYADMDDNGSVDGIIYVDLAKGKTATGSYNITAVTTGLKEYKISTKTYEGQTTPGIYKANDGFGTKKVISPVKGSSGTERFYIMALEDEKDASNNIVFYWYKNAYGNMSDYSSATSRLFGSGKSNTVAIKEKWDLGANGGYGATDAKDIWGIIAEKIGPNSKWFVPSIEEWTAFRKELGITGDDYEYFGFGRSYYWSSSQVNTDNAIRADFKLDSVSYWVNQLCCVRISATF